MATTLSSQIFDQRVRVSMKRVSDTYQDNGSLKAAGLIQELFYKMEKSSQDY